MEQILLIAAVICFAGFVGAAIPVLLQLRRTLQRAEAFLDTTGATLQRTLDEVSGAAATISRATTRIEASAGAVQGVFDAIGGLTGRFARLRKLLHGVSRLAAEASPRAAAVGPASSEGQQSGNDEDGARKGGGVA